MRISASKRGAMDLLPRYLSRGSENRRRKPISLIAFRPVEVAEARNSVSAMGFSEISGTNQSRS